MGQRKEVKTSRRIWLDDTQITLKYLLNLWRELPKDIRVNDETLPSSVVVFEALEYIRKLKGVLDIHDIADRITEFDDLYDDRCQDLGNYRELTGQTKFQELTPSEISNEDPQVATPLSKTQAPQPLPPHHPSPKQDVGSYALLNGKLVKIQPFTNTAAAGPTPNPSQPTPPPATPSSGGIRLENTATPSAVDAPPEVVDLPDSDDFPPSPPEPLESTSPAAPPRRPTVQSSLAVISAVAKVKSSAPDEVTHTAHCLDTCHCKEPPLDPEVVAKFATFKTENYKDYAMELMISARDDADSTTREVAVREHLFYTIFELCGYNLTKIRKFLLLLSSDYACDRFDVTEQELPDSDSCVLVCRRDWEDEGVGGQGMVNLGHHRVCLPVMLYKLFRPEAEGMQMQQVVLMSTASCTVSNPELRFERSQTVCLNPFHYKLATKDTFRRRPHPDFNSEEVNLLANKPSHVWRSYSSHLRGVQLLCQFCMIKYDGRAKARPPSPEPPEERTACDPDDTENIPASIPPSITSPAEKRLGAMTAPQGNHQPATPVTPKDELGSITLEQAGDGFETPPKEKLEQNVIWSSYLVNPSRGKAKCRHCLTIFSLDTRRKMGLTSSMKNHLLSHGFGFGRDPMGDEMEESEPVDLGQTAEESDMDDILGPAPLPPLGTPPTPQATPQNNAPQSMTQLVIGSPTVQQVASMKEKYGVTRQALDLVSLVDKAGGGDVGGPVAKRSRKQELTDRRDERTPTTVVIGNINNVSPPTENSIQCWRCLQWREPRVGVNNHLCDPQFSRSGELYTCRLCGVSDESKQFIEEHLKRCSQSKVATLSQNQANSAGLEAHLHYDPKPMPLFNDGDEEDRQRRYPKRVKCAQCNVEFYSERERLLHTEKTNRCNGYITCRCCGGAFSTSRATSHDSHACFTKIDGDSINSNIAKISDIKEIKNPCMKPVRCADCHHTIQSFGLFKRHKNALSKMKFQVRCGRACKKVFPSICEMLAHQC